ncbi:Succinate dehydrogenase assembly factor 2 mitochondrial [Dispira simplex]|nr:Succinate dehydrogenase assembly factor 2 mitochondrial [Dispira simplex]
MSYASFARSLYTSPRIQAQDQTVSSQPQITDPSEESFKNIEITRPPRSNESIDAQRRRIVYQSRKRGILENDLLLSNFVNRHVPIYERHQLDELDILLEIPDWDLYYYLTDKQPIPQQLSQLSVWPALQRYVREKRTSVLMMPNLKS